MSSFARYHPRSSTRYLVSYDLIAPFTHPRKQDVPPSSPLEIADLAFCAASPGLRGRQHSLQCHSEILETTTFGCTALLSSIWYVAAFFEVEISFFEFLDLILVLNLTSSGDH